MSILKQILEGTYDEDNKEFNPAIESIHSAYSVIGNKQWRNSLNDSPHGHPWFTSFHASYFPSDSVNNCARKAVYTMAGFASAEPFGPFTLNLFNMGKSIELSLVSTWSDSGDLLSAKPSADVQDIAVLKDYWLSCSVDAVIKHPKTKLPYVVEIKTKSDDVVTAMKSGIRKYDEQHMNQLLAQLSSFHGSSGFPWSNNGSISSGSILYVSRSNMSNVCEFKFDRDDDFFQSGLKIIEGWKSYFERDVIPDRDADFQWSKGECQSCKFKKSICKPDFRDSNNVLSESHGVSFSDDIYDDGYDFNFVKKAIYDRWN